MKKLIPSHWFALLYLLVSCTMTFAQSVEKVKNPLKVKGQPLFSSDEVLNIRIITNFRELQRDRGDEPDYHEATIIYVEADGDTVQVPLKVKARGNFRRQASNCSLPPLLLNFPKKEVEETIFKNQDKLKVVTRCRYEDFVPQEYMVYKLYNLITDYSFKARMAMITYEDISGKRKTETSAGFIIEDEDLLAKRHKTTIKGKEPQTPTHLTDQLGMATMAVFQYMIGNTDWSVPFQHNIKLLEQPTGLAMPVAYDFDHAGIVEASYATPAPELKLRSTRDRTYRGLGYSEGIFAQVFENFNRVKPQIYELYETNENLNPAYVKRTLKYLDQFYEIINDPARARSEFMTTSKGRGVVIKGMKD